MTENKTTTASEEAAPLPANAGLPLVTIGLPVYNGGEFLDEAVESLLAQDYSNFELLISDNGSTDTTRAICEEWAARDARVRLVRQPKNRGAMWNFHFVMRHALSEYFVWAAHDDLWEPDFLSSCMAVLLADPRAVLCHCVIQPIASDGARTGEEVWWKPLGQPQRRARWKQAVREPMVHAAIYGVMRRRHAIRAVKYLEAWGATGFSWL
jgi:glycosyltransferase involved in cell wall biosynthesis